MFHKTPMNGASSASKVSIEEALRAQLGEQSRALEALAKKNGELVNRYRYLQKELERAGRVQQSLLPQGFRCFEGYQFAALYQPCEAVGGDFFDVIHDGEGALVLVCDVVGHGLEAALATMLLKGVFHETARTRRGPAGLLSEMNDRLRRVIPSELFAVAAAARIAPRGSEIEVSNAGLPYPFLLQPSKDGLEELALPGFPLGLIPGAQYESRTVLLEPGDVLLLGTDGIRSVENLQGEHFEGNHIDRALRRLIGEDGKTVIETLMARALAFGGGSPLADDVNLVAITRMLVDDSPSPPTTR